MSARPKSMSARPKSIGSRPQSMSARPRSMAARPKSMRLNRTSMAYDEEFDMNAFADLPEFQPRSRRFTLRPKSTIHDPDEINLETLRDPEDFAWRRRYRQSLNDADLAEQFAQFMPSDVGETYLAHNRGEFEAVLEARPGAAAAASSEEIQALPPVPSIPPVPVATYYQYLQDEANHVDLNDTVGSPQPAMSDDLDDDSRETKASRTRRFSRWSFFRPVRDAFSFLRRQSA